MNTLARIAIAAFLVFAISCTKESKKTEAESNDTSAQAEAAKVSAQADPTTTGTEVAAAPADEHGACGEGGEEGSCCGGEAGKGEGGEGGSCCAGHAQAEATTADIPANAEWTTLKVGGMRCGGCAKRIQASLANVEGVLGVTADHGAGEVKVAAAPGTKNVRARAATAINALGYKVLDI